MGSTARDIDPVTCSSNWPTSSWSWSSVWSIVRNLRAGQITRTPGLGSLLASSVCYLLTPLTWHRWLSSSLFLWQVCYLPILSNLVSCPLLPPLRRLISAPQSLWIQDSPWTQSWLLWNQSSPVLTKGRRTINNYVH